MPDSIEASLTLLNKADEVVARIKPTVTADGNQERIIIGGELSGLDAVNVVVDIRHPGFTSFARRLPVESTLYMRARLSALSETTVTRSITKSISGAETNGFTVEINDGLSDKAAMTISIPASTLPAGTQSISAAVKTYDPNNTEDAQFFPGSYADSTGNGLVSVAFNYAEVKTNTGESLKALAQNAQLERRAVGPIAFATAAEPVIINRTIPDSSCSTLKKLGDSNAEMPGFQIPVYTYNPNVGLWDLLGHGSVFTEAGAPIGVDPSSLNCVDIIYVLEIKVTNEIFLQQWWNLDYPLAFREPKKYCATLQLLNEEQKPLPGVYGLLEGAGNFASHYFVSDSNGIANISVDVLSDDMSSVKYVIWDAQEGVGSVSLSSTCPTIVSKPIIVKRPQICKLEGKVTIDNRAYPGLVVSAGLGSDQVFPFFGYAWVYGVTNNEGIYSIELACGFNYQLSVGGPQDRNFPMVNVDGVINPDEQSDDGKLVRVKPIDVSLPVATLYLTENPRGTTQGKLTFVGAADAFPIAYNLKVKNIKTGQELAAISGSLAADPTFSWYIESDWLGWASGLAELEQNFTRKSSGQLTIPWTLPVNISDIYLQGSYTDARGYKTNVDKELLTTWVLYEFSLGH
jgi:hypothetical protein